MIWRHSCNRPGGLDITGEVVSVSNGGGTGVMAAVMFLVLVCFFLYRRGRQKDEEEICLVKGRITEY